MVVLGVDFVVLYVGLYVDDTVVGVPNPVRIKSVAPSAPILYEFTSPLSHLTLTQPGVVLWSSTVPGPLLSCKIAEIGHHVANRHTRGTPFKRRFSGRLIVVARLHAGWVAKHTSKIGRTRDFYVSIYNCRVQMKPSCQVLCYLSMPRDVNKRSQSLAW